MGAAAHLESRLVPVDPGSTAAVPIRVRNTGSVVDQFTIQILGDAAAWSVVTPPSVSLFPGAEETATISFSPPRSSRVPAGQLPFGVHVVSKEDPQGSVVEEGALEIGAFSDVFAELAPRTSRGSRRAAHDLAIDNRGNAAINGTLSAIDPDRLLDFELRPPGITAEPGTATFAKLAVRPRRTFWRGPSQTRPFQVVLESVGPTPVTVDGTLVQESILPPWFMRAVLALLGVLAALVLLWIFLFKPTIEAIAEEQTEDVLAAYGFTPAPQQPGSGPGATTAPPPGATQGPTGPGPSVSPGTSVGVASAPPLAGGGSPAGGRLESEQLPLVVDADKTLFITDLVFSNPADDAVGALRLVRSNEPLLTLQLQNFRDLDFHFVTPIVVSAGQSLSVVCEPVLACNGPNGRAAVYYSGYQR